jgi:hypothetical protein
MKTENPDVDVILADTGKVVEESIRRITIEKMTVLVEQLFPSWGNPWEEIIFNPDFPDSLHKLMLYRYTEPA